MKKLRTLREVWKDRLTDGDYEYSNQYLRDALNDLREEAKNWVENCNNREDFATNNECGFYYDKEKKQIKPRPVFCDACRRFIKFFNLQGKEDR